VPARSRCATAQPILTSHRKFGKTELVSACIDYRRISPVASFWQMATKRSKSNTRKPRADAQRNRERILEVAKEAFTQSGADTSLDDIAKQAGVGPGTLYRHFPTREELLVAVYRTEMERLAAAEQKLAETMPPIEALRAWLLLFVDAVATKQIIAPALKTLVGDPKKVFEASYAQIHEAIRALVKRAIKNGDIRKDLDPIDVLRALVGVAHVASSPDWQQSARRLVDILITGSRPIK
jgi:AcrR family transcriptional regulator